MVVEQEDDDVELTNVPIFFPLNEEKAYNNNWLCIIDEASMVSSKKSGSDDLFFGSGVLLEDIMTFADTNNSSKVIFIGDPAQLPPVGDNDSQALKPEWFKERGYKVSTSELTDIIRQQEDSAILQNSLKIRNLLETDIRNELIFETKEDEVIDVSISEMIDIFTENWRNGDKGAIITYKNSDALSINKIVRQKLGLPRDIITIGDRMLVVSNNGKYFNGDMVTISDILSDIEEISVTLKDKINGVVQSREVRLQFLDVKLTNEEGETHSEKLFINLINTANPYPTKDQLRALYIYFCIRYNKKNNRTSR